MKNRRWSVLALTLFSMALFVTAACSAEPEAGIPPVPTPGLVTLVDIGAHKCIPCKMMAPIIEELKKEYAGRASIIFIDVWEHREQGAKFGVSAIPTQIFYDKAGKEISRHVGFMDKESIVAQLKTLGVK